MEQPGYFVSVGHDGCLHGTAWLVSVSVGHKGCTMERSG